MSSKLDDLKNFDSWAISRPRSSTPAEEAAPAFTAGKTTKYATSLLSTTASYQSSSPMPPHAPANTPDTQSPALSRKVRYIGDRPPETIENDPINRCLSAKI